MAESLGAENRNWPVLVRPEIRLTDVRPTEPAMQGLIESITDERDEQ